MLFAPLLCLALLPLLKGDLGPNMGNVTSAKPPTSSPSPVSFPLSSPEVLLATHTGREHMVEVPPVQKALAQTNVSGISSEVVKPVREESLLQETQQDGHKPVVPKKGEKGAERSVSAFWMRPNAYLCPSDYFSSLDPANAADINFFPGKLALVSDQHTGTKIHAQQRAIRGQCHLVATERCYTAT
ncbi:uncharacterized protein LOC109532971 isoform X3 [Dendroctonus ponderosae]|uniref:uncharacterized protein LOC109532971 isoform X3 n=1 Tax=Dendroctonus ponderosae TaxID=77166 RepID=UPI0020354E8A|nr:uncharacterized protein LOC109532971 isoform X3 [Dendroctonus ponderosae]